MKKLLLTLIIAFAGTACFAQELDKAKLDRYFQLLDSGQKFMGSIAVAKGGKLIYQNTTGYADAEKKIFANAHSRYRIGSVSKMFTAVLVMKATEEKKLRLDQTLENYFPGLINAKKISLSDMMYHRSGIHNFTNDADYQLWSTKPKTEAEMLEIITKGGSDFTPGSKTEYSNSNFVLLSYILEKVYGKSYAELLEEKIITPLGLKDTYFGGMIRTEKNECHSYKYSKGWQQEPETDMSIPMGAGGIVSSPEELIRFSQALFGGKLVSDASLKQMETIKDHMGMGLFEVPFYDKKGIGHTGGIDGFSTHLFYFPDGDITFALTANGVNYNLNDIAIAVLSAAYGKPYDMPVLTKVELTNAELEKYTGTYASKQIVLKIKISIQDNGLMAQATRQPAFPLEPMGKDKFKFDPAGVVIEFNPAENSMILKQGGGAYLFVKE